MTHLDLFSGIGGFALGIDRAGFNITKRYFSEIDNYAIKIYKRHFPDAIAVGSVTDVSRRDIGHIDIITFGSPCQDFSVAGKRAGMDGQRSSLIAHAIRLIDECKPHVFVWENVKGTFSSNAGKDFWAIVKAFTDIGCYRLEWQLLNTSWFLPQNRERIYLVGRLGEGSGREIFPIRETDELYNQKSRQNNTPVCVNTIDANYHKGWLDQGQRTMIGTLRTHKDGEGFREVKKSICPTIPARAREDGSGQPVIKAVLTPDRAEKRQDGRRFKEGGDPMFTLTGQDKHGVMISANTKKGQDAIRRLTPTECERLQGFPDSWTDGISGTQRYKCLGNAVSVPVVEAVFKRIKEEANK